MGLRILLSADWHLDSAFSSLPESEREALRREQRRIPMRIADVCREENCDLVLLVGDLFDGTPARQTVDAVREALSQCNVPVLISPGNHDFCGPGSPWLEENFPSNVHIYTGGLEAVDIPSLDCRVYGAGYQSMDCPPLLEGFQAEGDQRWCVGLLHGDPVNPRSPYCPVTAGQIRESGLDLLALGHIHKAGQFRAGETLCLWPGCPMGRGWDETGEKGVFLIDMDAGAEAHWLPLDTPRFYDLELDAEEDPRSILPGLAVRDHYRLTLTGFSQPDADILKELCAQFPNLTVRDHTRKLSYDADTLMGAYFGRLQELADTDPDGALALRISRQLLSGGEVVLP